jgi:hypothetical protein
MNMPITARPADHSGVRMLRRHYWRDDRAPVCNLASALFSAEGNLTSLIIKETCHETC